MKLGLQVIADKGEQAIDNLRDIILRIRMMVDNAHLGFGDGTNLDNIYGEWITYTTNAVANTEDTVTHNLGKIPVGFIVMSIDKAAILYKGTTIWTTSSLYLKCNVASTTVLMFVVGPSNQAF